MHALLSWKTVIAGGLALVVACWGVQAQEASHVLTLHEAMWQALERNPSIAAAAGDVVARQAALRGQHSRWLPTLTAEAGGRIQQSLARPVSVGGGIIQTGGATSETSDVTLSLRQTFYQSGLAEAIDAAREQTAASEASLEDSRRTLLLQTATTFYTILAGQEMAEIADDAVRAAELHLDLVDARIDAGTTAVADRLPVEAELADARFEAVSTLNAVWQALADLQALLALPPDELPLIRGELDDVPEREDLQSWLRTALAERPDLQARRHGLRATELAARQAEIDAGLSVSVTGQADDGRFTGTTGETWLLAAGVSYPLYNGQTRASVDQAHANLEVAEQRMAEAELAAARDVAQSWYALGDAEERITAADAALLAAASNLEAARERYAEGVVDVIAITDAELTWRRAAGRLVQSRYDRIVAHYRLLAAAGRLRTTVGADAQAREGDEAGTVVEP